MSQPFCRDPTGALVYHGFPILDDVQVDGFRLGIITDWEAEETDSGDAFIVAPDGSRAGLVWEITGRTHVERISRPDATRWGVWSVELPGPMRTRQDARRNLAAIVPMLQLRWEEWRSGPNHS